MAPESVTVSRESTGHSESGRHAAVGQYLKSGGKSREEQMKKSRMAAPGTSPMVGPETAIFHDDPSVLHVCLFSEVANVVCLLKDRFLDKGAGISAGLPKVKGQVEFLLVTLRALLSI